MKQSDIITAALIAIIGTIAAYFLVDSIMGNPEDETVSFKYVGNSVSSVAAEPDSELFNDNAINPTVDVYIGDGTCVDQNQDGELDIAEKIACGMASMEEVDESNKQNTETETEDDIDRAIWEANRQNILNNNNNSSSNTSTSGTNTNGSTTNTTNATNTTNTTNTTSTTGN